jgi:hypothetical protein
MTLLANNMERHKILLINPDVPKMDKVKIELENTGA